MLELLEPDWNLNGKAAAGDLQRSVHQALRRRLQQLKAPPSGTLSPAPGPPDHDGSRCAATSSTRRAAWGVTCCGLAIRERTCSSQPGARQLTTDDLRDPGDALANLRRDSVVSNAMSADTQFHVNYRKVELRAPFLVVCTVTAASSATYALRYISSTWC